MYVNGLGDTWAQGKTCPAMPTEAAAFVLQGMNTTERLALEAAAPDTDTRQAIIDRNPLALAWHLAGGDDCQTTSAKGTAFVALFQATQDAIEKRTGVVCDIDPATGMYTCPEIDVTGSRTPNGTGQGDQGNRTLGYALGALGIVFLLAGDRSRARRR